MVKPDYHGGCIVNLMQSIGESCGDGLHLYQPLQGLDQTVLTQARNIVLLVIDGLGYDYLQQHQDSCLHHHLHSRITSVAPPTTASAVTAFLTGLAPQQHGLTGWFTYFREVGSIVTVLPYVSRASGASLGASGRPAKLLLGLNSFFDQLSVDCYSISPDWLQNSEFNRMVSGRTNRVPHQGYQHCFDEIVRIALSSDQKKYIYAYWPGLDAKAHEFGVGSEEVSDHFFELDKAFKQVLDQLVGSETVVLVSADHGFIDTTAKRHLDLADHPKLKETLLMPLCGEPRMAYCYVRNDKRSEFEKYVSSDLSEVCELHPSSDLIQQGLFGLGDPHPELLPRVGDYTLIMKDNYVMTGRLPGDKPLQMVGFHGGLSAAEVYVPLVLSEC